MTVSIEPRVTEHSITDRDNTPVSFTGRLLGSSTSFADHKDRWFDVSIYVERDGTYVVWTVGRTLNEDERPLFKIVRTGSAFDVIEVLTVHHRGKTYIPRASARALAQAAQWDDNIRDAYINRAVT